MTEVASAFAEGLAEGTWKSHTNRDRTLLAFGAIACYWLSSIIAAALSIPRFPKFDAALLHQPSPVLVIIVALMTLILCTLLGSLIAGSVHFEGGLFCASVGLVAFSVRGGPMRYTLFNASGAGVFLMLAVELLLLCAALAAAWYTLVILRERGLLRGEEHRHTHREREEIPSQTALAIAIQVGIMLVFMLLLAPNDLKGQVVWAIGFSSLLGTLAAHSLFPIRPVTWFLIGPLALGLAGYLIAWITGGYSPLGIVGGMVPPLARPLPLDYASMGPAGAMLGYWVSRGWHLEREHDPETEEEVEDALEHPNR